MQKLNRRTFFGATSLSGAGMFIGAQRNTKPARAATTENSIRLPETHIPIAADVVVIGGGPAGFGAAMRAARSGVKTLLIERFGGPGGAAPNGYMCTTGVTGEIKWTSGYFAD